MNQKLFLRFVFVLLAIAAVLGFLYLYLHVARIQFDVNDDMRKTDQKSYMRFAVKAYESNFGYTGGRNQMPLYPFLQALFYSPSLDDAAFFEQGKRINIGLSLVCLAVLTAAFFSKFSRLFSVYALLTVAFLVFSFKSPYFQTEILFYTLFGLAFITSVEALVSPKWYKSVGVGLLFALAHLSKASALPGLVFFVSSYVLLILGRLITRRSSRAELLDLCKLGAAPGLIFVVLLFPYFQESKQIYGNYLYNVNSTFYMWYDSWDEAVAGTRAAGDRVGWPDLPDEQIPSLSKYLDEHSNEQIIDRFRSGAQRLINFACILRKSKHRFGYCSQVGLNLIILACSLALIAVRSHVRHAARHIHVLLFIGIFHLFYALAFAWYMPLIGNGPRTILSLMIPFLWTTGLAVHSETFASYRLRILGWRLSASAVVYSAMLLTLFYEIYQVIDYRAFTMYGGE